MPLFHQRKPKRFRYKSRRDQDNLPDKERFEEQWQNLRGERKSKKGKLSSMSVLMILFIMVLILMYVLRSYE